MYSVAHLEFSKEEMTSPRVDLRRLAITEAIRNAPQIKLIMSRPKMDPNLQSSASEGGSSSSEMEEFEIKPDPDCLPGGYDISDRDSPLNGSNSDSDSDGICKPGICII
jgi:hypothetical protein